MDKIVKSSVPLVTVLLPVYNSEIFLYDAISSILEQSFTNFEFLIIDDGSIDKTSKILNEFNDSRIRIIKHSENKGVIYSLNEGMFLSKCKYIIRMDADDIALPNRIQVQVDFMNLNSDVAAAGSFYQIVGKQKIQKMPTTNNAIKVHMLFHTAMAHPTIILRRESFINNNFLFNHEFKHAEDYELWARSSVSLKFANIPEVLLKYRIHENQISTKYNILQRNSMSLAQLNLLLNLGIQPSEREISIHSGISFSEYGTDDNYLDELLLWLKKLNQANSVVSFFDEKELAKILSLKWFLISGHLALNGVKPNIIRLKNNFEVSKIIYLKCTLYLLVKVIIGMLKNYLRLHK
jgi:glycosyltransferase involved in cell wall biosynthesis